MEQVYNNTSLEDQFLHDDQDRCTIILGVRESGKTTLMNNIIKYHYTEGTYDEYHLIIPSFKTPKGVKQYPYMMKMKNTFIYSGYSPKILKDLIAKKKKKVDTRTLFIFDDSTSAGKEITKDPIFQQFFFDARGYQISIILICHSARKVVEKCIRENTDYIFLGRAGNRKLREDLWEEYFSTDYPKFQMFEENFVANVIKNDNYPFWCIKTTRGLIDYNVENWEIQHMNIEIKGKEKTKIQGDKTADKKEVEKKEVGKKTSLISMLKGSNKEKPEEKRKDFSSLFFRK